MPPERPYRCIAVLAILGCGLLFGSTLGGRDRLAFRDVGHFYAPLYEHVGQRMADWQLPLWNPLDHTGTPLIGETTTAMFYPPRWVFALPLSTSVAMGLYVVFHLILAALAAGWAAREAGCDGAAAVFAALAYALSCPIVFLYCNPPFLVGAAWLPCGLALGLRLLETRDARTIAAAALGFAMPVLAGDPQTPLHIAVWIGLVWSGRQLRHWLPRLLRRGATGLRSNTQVLPLLLAIGWALLIALPQVAGSWDWARHSARRFDAPQGAYHFSVPPWQWLDLLVPTAGGQLFPKFQRLSQLIPGDSRIWSVSLYGGVITLLLSVWRYCKRDRLGAWELLAPLGMLMAMGKFGPVWLLQAIAGGLGADAEGGLLQANPASWSPYWLLGHLLPGYESFRYPAKWLPFVSLGLAVTAARQLQELLSNGRPPLRRLAAVALTLLLVSLPLGIPASRDALLAHLPAGNLTDTYWGPLDRAAGLADLAYSLRHAGGVIALAAGLLWGLHRKPRRLWRFAGLALCGLLLADLVIVNMPLVATINRQQEAAWLVDQRAADGQQPSGQALLRTGDEGPAVWRQTSVFTRVEEVAASERMGLQGRWHLPAGHRVFNSATSITPQRYESCAAASARYTAPLSWEEQNRFWFAMGGHWGLTAYLHTSPDAIAASTLDGRSVRLMDTRWIPLAASAPAVRWHARWNQIPPTGMVSQQAWLEHFETILAATEPPVPKVEIDVDPIVAPELGMPAAAATVEVIDEAAESLRSTVRCPSLGLLSRPTFQDGHWHCRYRPVQPVVDQAADETAGWTTTQVYPVDYLSQGVLLPTGDWEVEFWYRPWWLTPTLSVSVLALMVVVRSANITKKR